MNSQQFHDANSNNKPQFSVIQGGNYTGRTDAELIVLCQQKDSRAFEELIKRHQRTVYALLYRLAPDWNDTADLAQEVFIRMWRSIGNLRNPSAFRSWLSQIVTNLFYDELRKRPRQLPTISMDEPLDNEEGNDSTTRDIRDKAAGPDELCQRNELTEIVRQAMTRLPEQFRTAIILREFEGLSYEEIALITHTEIGTVKSRIARARAKIQEMVSPYLKAA
ncbi:MAG TPA: sigma-70 family RNA polymerase sigma factor [Candidatus Obscuribacterales bacterium]